MNDTNKMLRAIINGQSALKEELLEKIDTVGKKVDKLDIKLSGKIDHVDNKLTKRIDKLGLQLARMNYPTLRYASGGVSL